LKKSLRRALWAGSAVAVAAGSVSVAFTSASDWGSGHQGTVTITNGTDAAINGWKIEFGYGSTISSAWDADLTGTPAKYTAVNKSWSPTIPAGGKFSWGYIGASGFKAPTSCTINGVSCGGGVIPTSPTPTKTSASPTPTKTSASPTPTKTSSSPTPSPTKTSNPPPPGDKWVVGYFAQWGIYARNYQVKNIDTSGSAAKTTHILYSFASSAGGRCALAGHPKADTFADYEKSFTADQSVDGVADTWDQPLRGNFNQLLKLKKKHPHLKVLLSVGGWSMSHGFPAAVADLNGFVNSCYDVINDPRWKGLFDGIDIDWEFPQDCGGDDNFCDTTSGYDGYKRLMQALRAKFGNNTLITSAITADGTEGGKIDKADYAGGAAFLDKLFVMNYDYFGGWTPNGPTAPHAPLTNYTGIPIANFYGDKAIQKLKSKGVPASKMLFGLPFYGRGWTGVTQEAPGGTAAGKAAGSWEAGVADYKDLKNNKCAGASIKTIAGTAYALCSGGNWWGFDTPQTIAGKMNYVKQQGLGGVLFWEFSGDTTNGELITAVKNGL
jgi:chitinase